MDNTPDLLAGLNSAQREAVITPPDVHGAIVAGAGTGKTRVLVHRMAYLIQQGIHPSRITAVTFTNKAAREMRDRVCAIVGEENALALRMGTFHSIGLKILRRYGQQLGLRKPQTLRPLDAEDASALLRRVMKDRLSEGERELIKPSEALGIITYWKDRGLLPGDVTEQATIEWALAKKLYAPYEQEKTQSNTVDFADMIFMPVRLLQARPEIAQRMHQGLSQLLIDEFQDTNPLQMTLVNLLTDCGRAVPTFVVGDDDQSIYSWRGADAGIFRLFLGQYTPAHLVRLEQNYRCSSLILDAANAVIARNVKRMDKTLFTDNAVGDFIQLRAYRDAEGEADAVAEAIRQCLENGEKPDQIAILYRKNSFSRLLEHALLRYRIPYRIYGGTAFFGRKEIKDALAYLRLVHDRTDDEAFVRAVGAPPKGMGAKSMSVLRAVAQSKSLSLCEAALQTQHGKVLDFMQQVDVWAHIYQERGLGDLVYFVLRDSGLEEYYLTKEKEKGEERVENLSELLTAARIFHHDYHMGETNSRSMAPKPGDPLSEFLTEAILDADGAAAASKSEAAVQMMSVHKSKGLEFDRVFIVGMEQGEFPSAKAAETREGLEEERRLFYVAMTRARHHLHLSLAQYRMRFGGEMNHGRSVPSPFLEEIPPHLLDHELQDAGHRLPNPRKMESAEPHPALSSSGAADLW